MRISVFDIGGTFIKHSIFNGFSLSETKHLATCPQLGKDHLIDTLIGILRKETEKAPLDGIGISTRGQVDFFHGVIIFDPPDLFPDYSNTPLRQLISQKLNQPDIPVIIENDGNCAAIAESAFGSSQTYDNSLCIVYGTAIGGGIIHQNKIYRGSNDSAGEFGMMHFPDGHNGSISYENYASVTKLIEMVSAADASLTDGKKIVTALSHGDKQISCIIDQWCFRVAVGLSSLIHIFNPPCVVLGGGIMENSEIVSRIRKQTFALLAPGFEGVQILPATLGNRAGMLGAAYLTLQEIQKKG